MRLRASPANREYKEKVRAKKRLILWYNLSTESQIDGGLIDAQLCGTLDLELGNTDPTIREICDDRIDNDGDGRVDETPCAVIGPFPE